MRVPESITAHRTLLTAGALGVTTMAVAAAMHVAGPRGAVLALAAVAAVSLAVIGTRLEPAHILSAGCVLALMSGNWSLVGMPFGVDRLVVLAGIAATLVAAARDPRLRLVTRPVHLGLAATAAWAVCSSLLAGTLGTTVAIYALVDRYGLMPFMVFAVAPYAFRTLAARLVLVRTMVLTGAYLGLTAVFEQIGPRALVFPRFITDPTVGLHADRARGPFLEASADGLVLVMCAVICWYGAVHLAGRWRHVAMGSGVLCGIGIALTLTRSAWIAAVVAGLAVMLFTPRLRRYALPSAASLALVVVAALALLPGFAGSAEQRAADRSPVWDRQNLITASVRIIERHPLEGLGWGRFAEDSPGYFRQTGDVPLQGEGLVVHNVPLLYATETGLVGFGLWAIAAGVALLGPLRRRLGAAMDDWQAAHLAIVLAWLIVGLFAPLSQSLPNLLVFMWAGVTSGAVPWLSPLSARPAPGAGPADAPRGTPAGAERAAPAPS